MKRFAYLILVLSGLLVFTTGARAQTCSGYQAYWQPWSGPNNCNSGVALVGLDFSSAPTCMQETFMWCCSTQFQDWNSVGYCNDGGECEDVDFLKNPDVIEFGLTHTLWARDCSGHFGSSARSWDAQARPIEFKPRLSLSGIGL